MKTVSSYTATIYVGFRSGRTAESLLRMASLEDAKAIVRAFVDEREHAQGDPGGCVTVTPTEFMYVNGGEPGCAVGFINYPRFPSTPEKIRAAAIDLARRLLTGLWQMKVSIVFPDETVMLESGAA